MHMLQYLPLSEQPLDSHLVSCIIKKFLSARRKSQSSERNAIFPSSLLYQVINFFSDGKGKEVFLCKQFLFLVDVAVFAPEHAIVGIPCYNQRWLPEKRKKGPFGPFLLQDCRLNTGIIF